MVASSSMVCPEQSTLNLHGKSEIGSSDSTPRVMNVLSASSRSSMVASSSMVCPEQSTLNQASQTSLSWLNTVPLGQTKEYLRNPPLASSTHMWYIWQKASS